MAWGSTANAGIDDIVERVRQNDATLRSLYLMRTRRFDEGGARALGDALAENTTLVELHLSSHPVNTAQARYLASGLAKNSCLRHVSIGNSALGDEALVALCEGFRMSSSLQTLDLEKKGLTSASCGSLGEAVLKSKAIRHLMLSDNDIGDRGVVDILRCLSRLEALELCACLRDADQWTLVAEAMGDACPEARSLRRLELDRNALDERGARALAGCLPRLSALESFSINGNPEVGPGGVRALAFPPSLRRLDIGSTGAGDDGLCGLAELIESGGLPGLEYVNVCGCGATSVGLTYLLDSLQATARATSSKEGSSGGSENKIPKVEVDAGGNALNEGLEKALASVIQCQRLESLRLHGCALGAGGSEALVNVFNARKTAESARDVDENARRHVSAGPLGDFGSGTTASHALRDLDISGNGIPEAHMLAVLDALKHAVAADGPFPCLKTLIIAANPDVEGPKIAERVESLADMGVVIMRAANDGDK